MTMASSPGRQVDPSELIKRLSQKIADLQLQNTMYEIALEELEGDNARMQATIDNPTA